jgi:rhodanese-related sulfurtransferase/CBS domain-containing protein
VRHADLGQVQRLIREGAQLVEVLPEAEYRPEHLPGAVNLPLTDLRPQNAAQLDPNRPTVVYCYDTQCDLSARGAALLECYGFHDVYDFTVSKAAWFAMGLPAEGTIPSSIRAGALAKPATTCTPDTRLDDLTAAGPGDVVVVVNADDVVLGAVRPPSSPMGETTVGQIMQLGPPTVRPSITADELAQSMDKQGQSHIIVTTFDGRLVGVVDRQDLDVDR